MAQYYLSIGGNNPLSPIVRELSGKTYKRRDAAFNALEVAIYRAFQSIGLLDRQVAVAAMAWAKNAEKNGALTKPGYHINWMESREFTFSLTRER